MQLSEQWCQGGLSYWWSILSAEKAAWDSYLPVLEGCIQGHPANPFPQAWIAVHPLDANLASLPRRIRETGENTSVDVQRFF